MGDLDKIIITGANGVGKSYFAAKLALVRPDVPVVSFDAIKLTTNWEQRPRTEIDAALSIEIAKPAWILEGGPSLLFQAVEQADALIWLDPPEHIRACQLLSRPWKFFGQTRPELPTGNVDWPVQQYRFALRSLKNKSRFRSYITEVFESTDDVQKWRCRSQQDRDAVITQWASTGL
ncbi:MULTISPECIES: DNA topology modulation protein FlaR [unclassified Yoonia]|uniref:DNA topology modulation protein FlaR n=1 Tax=unclassified Yoonia TaxID=2629118 RepID=UPI002AFE08CB|nr:MULTISPECIES: DNA topology modulation protein FlaR [unclassified Yoonia]